MNATGGISTAKACRRWLKASDTCLQRSDIAQSHTLLAPLSWSTPERLRGDPCNALKQINLKCSPSDGRRSNIPKKKLNRTILRLSEPSQPKFTLTAPPTRSGNNVRDCGHPLAMSRDELLFWEVDSKYKKNLVNDMYRFKDHGIEIVVDEDNPQREALTSFRTLILLNRTKASILSLDQCLKLSGNPELSINSMNVW